MARSFVNFSSLEIVYFHFKNFFFLLSFTAFGFASVLPLFDLANDSVCSSVFLFPFFSSLPSSSSAYSSSFHVPSPFSVLNVEASSSSSASSDASSGGSSSSTPSGVSPSYSGTSSSESSNLPEGGTNEEEHMLGCEGHVLNSDGSLFSDEKADLSLLSVTLLTEEGIIKERQYCTPNGYYFIPLLDGRRTYIIRINAPEGWSFKPNEFLIHGYCKNDLNFVFTGFSLPGRVLSAGSSEGPSNLSVELYKKKEKIDEVKTTEGGKYTFNRVSHGEVEIRISHDKWIIDVPTVQTFVGWNKKKEEKLNEENKQLVVKVYDVTGFVQAPSHLPSSSRSSASFFNVPDVLIYVCAKSKQSVEICQQNKKCCEENLHAFSSEVMLLHPEEKSSLICIFRTNRDGMFSFLAPVGTYDIKIFPEKNKKLHFNQNAITALVNHQSLLIQTPFKVTSFEVTGRVLYTNTSVEDVDGTNENSIEGIMGAKILVNGSVKAISDTNGFYFIHFLSEGFYTVTATHDLIKFPSLTNVGVNAVESRFPDLYPSEFAVCGMVSVHTANESSHRSDQLKRYINIKGDNRIDKTTETNKDGTYCFYVPPGVYTLKAQWGGRGGGGVLKPHAHSVNVRREPILNIDFSETKTTLGGVIKCLTKPCDRQIAVLIKSLNPDNNVSYTVISGVDSQGVNRFEVTNSIQPGEYSVTILDDVGCWKQKEFRLKFGDVMESDVSMVFEDKGVKLWGTLSHDANFYIRHRRLGSPRAQQGETKDDYISKLIKGRSGNFELCVDTAKEHEILADENCFKFEKSAYVVHHTNKEPIHLKVSEVKVEGSISMDMALKSNGSADLSNTRVYAMLYNPQGTMIKKVPCTYKSCEEGKSNQCMYTYSFWVDINTEGYIEVEEMKEKEKKQGVTMLFFPPKIDLNIQLNENGCAKNKMYNFQSFIGKPIEGRVNPPMPGVSVIVKLKSTGEKIATAVTDNEGVYTTPPLFADKKYIVEAAIDDYRVEKSPQSPYDFKLFRLARINMEVYEHDSPSSEMKIPLSGVLFSLSSATHPNFRARRLSKDGQVYFKDLLEGVYYLRPLSKEYVFEPPQMSVQIQQGEVAKVNWKAIRVAFSCYGSLKSLTNINAVDFRTLFVQALDRNGEAEEAAVSAGGQYEIRGLKPHVEYILSIRSNVYSHNTNNSNNSNPNYSKIFERSSPLSKKIVMNRSDITGVDFYVFSRPEKVTLTVALEDLPKAASILQLFRITDSSSPELVVEREMGILPYFEITNLVPQKYRVVVLSGGKTSGNGGVSKGSTSGNAGSAPPGTPRKGQTLYSEVIDLSPSSSKDKESYMLHGRYHVQIPSFSDQMSTSNVPSSTNLSKSPLISFLLFIAILALCAKHSGIERQSWYQKSMEEIRSTLYKGYDFCKVLLSMLNIQFVVTDRASDDGSNYGSNPIASSHANSEKGEREREKLHSNNYNNNSEHSFGFNKNSNTDSRNNSASNTMDFSHIHS